MNSAERRDAALLDDYLGRLQRGEGDVDAVSREQPDAAARLNPLLQTAMRVRAAAPAGGLPEQTRAAGEARLRAGLRRRVPVPASTGARPRPRLLRPAFVMLSLVAVLAILASGSGVAYASESSLPGDSLYPVKRAVEAIRLGLSMTDEGDADLLMAMAEERLAEATQLAGQPRGADLAEALAGYDQAISRLLSLSHGASTDQGVAALEKVQARLAKHTQLLAGLRERAPAAAKDGLERALERSNERRNEVDDLLRQRGNRPETPPGRDPGTTPAPLVPTEETGRGKGPKEDRGPSTKIPPGQATPSP